MNKTLFERAKDQIYNIFPSEIDIAQAIVGVLSETTADITAVGEMLHSGGGHWHLPLELSSGYVATICVGVDDITRSANKVSLSQWMELFYQDCEDDGHSLWMGDVDPKAYIQDYSWHDKADVDALLAKLNKWGAL